MPGGSRGVTRAGSSAGDVLWVVLAIMAIGAQVLATEHLGVDGAEGLARRAIFLAPAPLVAVLAWRFRRYVGAWLIGAGIILNTIPMVAHGGLMPVAYEAVQANGANPELTESDVGKPITGAKNILLYRDDIRFEWLADRFHPGWPGTGTAIFSAGDVVEVVGVGAVFVQVIAGLGAAVMHRRRGDEYTRERPGAPEVA